LAQFDPGVVSGELPVYRSVDRISMVLPRSDLRTESRCVMDTSIQTLSFEDNDLNFSHIQPASSLRSVVKFEPIKIGSCLVWREKLVKPSWLVRIELIHHNPDAVRIRVVNICEFDHPVNPLFDSPFFTNLDVHPTCQRLS